MGTIPAYPDFANGGIVTDTKLDTIKAAGDFWASPPRCSAYLSAAQTLTTAVGARSGSGLKPMTSCRPATPRYDNATNNSRIVARTTSRTRCPGRWSSRSTAPACAPSWCASMLPGLYRWNTDPAGRAGGGGGGYLRPSPSAPSRWRSQRATTSRCLDIKPQLATLP